jgi:hypothetical protein
LDIKFLEQPQTLGQETLGSGEPQLEANKHSIIHLYSFSISFAIPTNRWRTSSMGEENDTTAKHDNTFCFAKRSSPEVKFFEQPQTLGPKTLELQRTLT